MEQFIDLMEVIFLKNGWSIYPIQNQVPPLLWEFSWRAFAGCFAVTYKGTAPTYFDFYQIMINGTTGNVEWIDSIGDMHYASANAFDANDGRDEVLVSLNNYVGHFEHELVLIDFQNSERLLIFNLLVVLILLYSYVGDLNNDNKLKLSTHIEQIA